MAYFKYWFRYTDPKTNEVKTLVFYDASEKGARRQYEKLLNKEPGKLLRRENW